MVDFTNKDLEAALLTIKSMIDRSEKVQLKLEESSPQLSLTKNRVKALYISLNLIKKNLDGLLTKDYEKKDLEKALLPITSTIRKCEKAQKKFKVGSSQATLTKKMIKALYISSSLIAKELKI